MKEIKMIKGEINNYRILKQLKKKRILKNRKQETIRQWTMKRKGEQGESTRKVKET